MEEQEKRQLVKDVGARVYACRTGAGMSREAMAERLGISPQYVSEIEQGKKCMSMSIFVNLGGVLHRPLDELAHGREPPDPGVGRAVGPPRGVAPPGGDMVVHYLELAVRAVQELGRED